MEEKSTQSNGEKVEVLSKRLQKKADEIISLENRFHLNGIRVIVYCLYLLIA